MRRRYWYHVTTDYRGPEFFSELRLPRHSSLNEAKTPRLCVCPTIAGCFAARMFEFHKHCFVYKTEKPYRGVKPRNVWDQLITRERWIVEPVRMVHVANINGLTAWRMQNPILWYHKETGKNSGLLVRLAQYIIAVDAIGGPQWELNFVERARRRWGMENPKAWILRHVHEILQKQDA